MVPSTRTTTDLHLRLASCLLLAITGCGQVDTDVDAGRPDARAAIDASTTDAGADTYVLTVTLDGSGDGTVTSAPAGIDCGDDCTEAYEADTVVTLTATPEGSASFGGWSGACTGTGTCEVTMDAAKTVTAAFNPPGTYSLTVTLDGTGAGTVTSDPAGIDCGDDCTEQYDEDTVVTLTAVAADGSAFTGWSGGGCSGTDACEVTLTASTWVTAEFTLGAYGLNVVKAGTGSGTVTSNPTGINCGTDCSEPYDYDTVVTLTASASTGSTFGGWSGGGCSGTGTCVVTMTAATTVTATFTLNQYTLTAAKDGNGTGTVTSNPTGINCGTDCTESYGYGTTVTLTASADAGSTFVAWAGGGCTGTGTCVVTVSAATTVTATFLANQYTLTVLNEGTGNGTVTSDDGGIDCGADCSEPYGYDTTVTLTASAEADSTFDGWTGGGCDGTGTCVVTMTAAATVTATFTLKQYTLTVTTEGPGIGTVTSDPIGIDCGTDCTEDYGHGTIVTLTASAGLESNFDGWTGAGCGGTGTCEVTMTALTSVTATFSLNQYPLNVTKSGNGTGLVSSTPGGIVCGGDCAQSYDYGTEVTLTAVADDNSAFDGWTGGGCDGTGTCVVTVEATTTVDAAFSSTCPPGNTTFYYTGGFQTFTVPSCVTQITVDARGGSGGGSATNAATYSMGGKGGRTQATLAVTPSSVIYVVVGGKGVDAVAGTPGTGGYNGGGDGNVRVISSQYGGGGGGSSDLRVGGTAAAYRRIVASGGGGAAACSQTGYAGGPGGGLTGGVPPLVCGGATAATGGTQSAGGSGGVYQTSVAGNGALLTGGDGAESGGGGGAGYYGGGGGAFNGGAGGSGYAGSGTSNVTHTSNYQSGNGVVYISW